MVRNARLTLMLIVAALVVSPPRWLARWPPAARSSWAASSTSRNRPCSPRSTPQTCCSSDESKAMTGSHLCCENLYQASTQHRRPILADDQV